MKTFIQLTIDFISLHFFSSCYERQIYSERQIYKLSFNSTLIP